MANENVTKKKKKSAAREGAEIGVMAAAAYGTFELLKWGGIKLGTLAGKYLPSAIAWIGGVIKGGKSNE